MKLNCSGVLRTPGRMKPRFISRSTFGSTSLPTELRRRRDHITSDAGNRCPPTISSPGMLVIGFDTSIPVRRSDGGCTAASARNTERRSARTSLRTASERMFAEVQARPGGARQRGLGRASIGYVAGVLAWLTVLGGGELQPSVRRLTIARQSENQRGARPPIGVRQEAPATGRNRARKLHRKLHRIERRKGSESYFALRLSH